jgi:hypothetical protein
MTYANPRHRRTVRDMLKSGLVKLVPSNDPAYSFAADYGPAVVYGDDLRVVHHAYESATSDMFTRTYRGRHVA